MAQHDPTARTKILAGPKVINIPLNQTSILKELQINVYLTIAFPSYNYYEKSIIN
jgi:hypothetical protein